MNKQKKHMKTSQFLSSHWCAAYNPKHQHTDIQFYTCLLFSIPSAVLPFRPRNVQKCLHHSHLLTIFLLV